jgi:hypothetical protein
MVISVEKQSIQFLYLQTYKPVKFNTDSAFPGENTNYLTGFFSMAELTFYTIFTSIYNR